jgi:hypothetical protein
MMTHNADLATAQLIGRVRRQDLDMDDLRYFLRSPSTTAAVIREVSLAEGWWLHEMLEYSRKEIRAYGHLLDCGPDADKHLQEFNGPEYAYLREGSGEIPE